MMKHQNATNKMTQFVTVKSLIWQFVTDAGTDLTLWSKLKVIGHQQWDATHRLEMVYLHAKYEKSVLNDKKVTARTRFIMDARTMVRNTSSGGGLPTCQICKACLERQKSYSPDMICYGRTDRLITIGHPSQSDGALIKYATYQRGNQKP